MGSRPVLPEVTVQDQRDRHYLSTQTTASFRLELPPRDQVNVIETEPISVLEAADNYDRLPESTAKPARPPVPSGCQPIFATFPGLSVSSASS
jgi:hypothetical protein